jgi:hypothetical protein
MPKHVDFSRLVTAINSMCYIVEVELMQDLLAAINLCQSQTVRDESAHAKLWTLYQMVPANLRSQFSV